MPYIILRFAAAFLYMLSYNAFINCNYCIEKRRLKNVYENYENLQKGSKGKSIKADSERDVQYQQENLRKISRKQHVKDAMKMTELEKLDAGLEYDFFDDEVNGRKLYAIDGCNRIHSIDQKNEAELSAAITEFFGSAGEGVWVGPGFQCDYGKNIHVGKNFTANYNVIILDIAPVHIGNDCMIGPNTIITTVGHPLSPAKRRKHTGIAKPVTIGDDVWIGGNCTILPGITIGNNVVVAAGAVVTKDVPDNCLVAGVPAKVMKEIADDVER